MNCKVFLIISITLLVILGICIFCVKGTFRVSLTQYFKYLNSKSITYEPYKNTYSNDSPPFPIDIVYSWGGEKVSDDRRASNNNELKYSLRSVAKFVPWVNRIFILINPPKKVPSWFNERYGELITLVDETETFPKGSPLPNKNSNAIETTIHNIPGLSEHFIYSCDDFFIGRPVSYREFFTEDGKALIPKKILLETDMEVGKSNLDIKFPKTVVGHYPHIPIPLRKSTILEYQKEYSDYIDWVRSFQTREGIGCNVCDGLICPCQQQHYPISIFMYKKGLAEIKNFSNINLRGFFKTNKYINWNRILKNPPKFFCINDDEEDSEKRKKVYKQLNTFFSTFYDTKAFFEK
jgi:hypothetical protein